MSVAPQLLAVLLLAAFALAGCLERPPVEDATRAGHGADPALAERMESIAVRLGRLGYSPSTWLRQGTLAGALRQQGMLRILTKGGGEPVIISHTRRGRPMA